MSDIYWCGLFTGHQNGVILLIVSALWNTAVDRVYQPSKSWLGICGVYTVWKLPCLLPMRGNAPVLFLCEEVFCTHFIESWISYLSHFYWLIKVLSFHICELIESHIWNDRITYVIRSTHICGTTFFLVQRDEVFLIWINFHQYVSQTSPFLKDYTKRLKAFWVEHCDSRCNTVAETYESRTRKLQYDFVEIDRRVRNNIYEFLSRTHIYNNPRYCIVTRVMLSHLEFFYIVSLKFTIIQ